MPTSRSFGFARSGVLARISASTAGAILQPQPPPWLKSVRRMGWSAGAFIGVWARVGSLRIPPSPFRYFIGAVRKQRRPGGTRWLRRSRRRPFARGVRARPCSRRSELPGARRRGTRPGRHGLQAWFAVRGAQDRRSAGREERWAAPGDALRTARPALEAADLLLAWRQTLGVDGACAARNRLGCGGTAGRLPELPACRPCATRITALEIRLSGDLRADRKRQKSAPAKTRFARCAGARPRTACEASGLRAGRPARRSAAVAENVRKPDLERVTKLRCCAPGVRRSGKQKDRVAASARSPAGMHAHFEFHTHRGADDGAGALPHRRIPAFSRRTGLAEGEVVAAGRAAFQSHGCALDRANRRRGVGGAGRRP